VITIESDVREMLEAILQGMDSIEKRITSEREALRQDIDRVNLTMENEIKPNIQLLAEGFTRLPDFHKMESDVENIKRDVDTIKDVVTQQSKDISNLQIIK
jgi:hypothetical protein